MKPSTLRAALFAFVTGCGFGGGGTPDANLVCGTYPTTPMDATCQTMCQAHGCATGFCAVAPTDGGGYQLTCYTDHTGRRPAGLARATAPRACATGRYLALAAHLEAASVPAFERVARELAAFGAPARLRTGALRAAREERRHARVMARLASSHGAHVPAVRVRATKRRSLEAFARDNAIEGCVKETFGAALAMHQARAAADPALRAALATIAKDELGHAELAWRIDAWVASRLSPAGRARVDAARRAAAQRLHRRELASIDTPEAAALGLPPRERRCALAAALATFAHPA